MPNFLSIIQRVRKNQYEVSDWLYIAGPVEGLSLESEADLGCGDFNEETDEEIDPPGFRERNLRSTIDVETVKASIDWADQLVGAQDDAAALDVIRYYIRFDAWPKTLNAPDPPSPEETLLRFAQAFCQKLGPEDASKLCKTDGCERGTVKFSVHCRRHHFEKVQNRPYPFED